MGADGEAPQTPGCATKDGEVDKLETLSQASSVPGFIDRLCMSCWVMQFFVRLPMLILYAAGALAFLVWFMIQHYEYVLAFTSVAYLALLAIYYAFSLQFKDLKLWLKQMMHRVLVELPKNIVFELSDKTQAHLNEAHQKAKYHMGKAEAHLKGAADHVGDKLDQVQVLLDSLGDDVHEELQDQFTHLKGAFTSVLRLHKQKTEQKIAPELDAIGETV